MKLIVKPIVSIIAAYTDDNAYGLGNEMPWSTSPKGIPGDLRHFYTHTTDAPEGKRNVLIGGSITAETMQGVQLDEKRLFIGVSRKVEQGGESNGEGRYLVQSLEEAIRLAHEFDPHRIIIIGGEFFWVRGLALAHEAHLTVVHKRCLDEKAVRLREPLHRVAHDCDLTLVSREFFDTSGIDGAWATSHERQRWTR